jgi:hypothetical protein
VPATFVPQAGKQKQLVQARGCPALSRRLDDVATARSKLKATCVEVRFLAEVEYRDITSEGFPSRQLAVSVAAEVR